MFFPKLVKYLHNNNIKHIILDGNVNGLNKLKKLINNDAFSITGIILSGSPIMLNDSSNVEDYICNLYCLKHLSHIPILGICFGCQLINLYFGGNLYDMSEVKCSQMHIETHNVNNKINKIWNLMTGNAQFCCRYLPKRVPHKHLTIFMYVKENNIKLPCVIQHNEKNITGVMFHPEAIKKTNLVLDEFIRVCTK